MDSRLIDRFCAARVARLATITGDGRPHVVPITFAADADSIVFAVDQKPKRSSRLKRVENLRLRPAASVIVDHYTEAWDHLWWVRADGRARLVEPSDPDHSGVIDRLAAKYRQYRRRRPNGTAVEIAVDRWSGWSAGESSTHPG